MIIDEKVIEYYEHKDGYWDSEDREFYSKLCKQYLNLIDERETDIIERRKYIIETLNKFKNTDAGYFLRNMTSRPITTIQRALNLAKSMHMEWEFEQRKVGLSLKERRAVNAKKRLY